MSGENPEKTDNKNLGDRLADLTAESGDLSEEEAASQAVEAFIDWSIEQGIELYPHQEEALLEAASGAHVIVDTPTGSGKTMIALAAQALAFAQSRRSFYTAPIKA